MIYKGFLCVLLGCVLLTMAHYGYAADNAGPGVNAIFTQAYEEAGKERSDIPLRGILDDHFSAVLLTIGAKGQESIATPAALEAHFNAIANLIGNGTYVVEVHPDGPADYAVQGKLPAAAEATAEQAVMASAHGTENIGLVTGQGTEYHLSAAWTAVFRKQGGQWKLLRLQESMDPVDNPLVIMMKHDILVRGSFVALLVGMALGWAFYRLIMKKPSA